MHHIALLRGINVGGKNMLPMKDLAALFAAAGCDDVVTYIQSGNVVFEAGRALSQRIPALVQAAILERFGYRIPVVTRTAEELGRAIAGNPFLKTGADPDTLHVAFLSTVASAAGIAKLDPQRSPPDEFRVQGRDIYLRLPNGVARSKLTNAWFDSTLSTTSTLRNWRTVLKLLEMTQEDD